MFVFLTGVLSLFVWFFLMFFSCCLINSKNRITDTIQDICFYACIVMMGISVLFMVVAPFVYCTRTETEPIIEKEYSLASFVDNTETGGHGNFLYITVSSVPVYTFYYQLDNGGYKQNTLAIENTDVTIFETNDVSPTIIKYEKTYHYKLLGFYGYFFIPEYYYEIYVPVNSIVHNYTLDSM